MDSAKVSKSSIVVLVLLSMFLTFHFLQHPSDSFSGGRAEADGLYYYAYLRSLFFDHDVDFSNDYQILGNQFNLPLGPRNKPTNIFTVGPAVLWSPFFLVAHATATVGNHFGWTNDAKNGNSTLYQRITFFGSLLWGVCGLFLAFFLLRKLFEESIALAAILGLGFATSLLWFLTRQSSFSHALDAFIGIAFGAYWYRTLFEQKFKRWVILGLLLGLAALVRPQNVAHAILPIGEAMFLFFKFFKERNYSALRRLAIISLVGAAFAVVVFFPQLAAWKSIYGKFFLVPQGKNFMQWRSSMWTETLFSSRNGLLAWHPLLSFSFLGLFIVAGQRSQNSALRLFAVLSLLATTAQIYINGCAMDWWAGWSFGGRRFSSCALYFALGLAAFLSFAKEQLYKFRRQLYLAAPVLFVLLFALMNFSLMDEYEKGRVAHAQTQDMSAMWKTAANKITDVAYKALGNFGAIPASWNLAVRGGISPARYDLIGGNDLFHEVVQEQINLVDSPLVLGGFSEPQIINQENCRVANSDSSIIALPLRKPDTIKAIFRLNALQQTAKIDVEVNGQELGQIICDEGWANYSVRLPKKLFTAGINYLKIKVKPGNKPKPVLTTPLGQTGLVTNHEITLESGGLPAGNSSIVYFNRKKFSYEGRGFHLVAFNLAQESVRHLGTFDTCQDPTSSITLLNAVKKLPLGTIAALLVNDDASERATEAVDQAINLLGGKESMRNRFRYSYALLGQKGLAHGQALEQVQPKAKAIITVGRPFELRQEGVAVARLTLAVSRPAISAAAAQ